MPLLIDLSHSDNEEDDPCEYLSEPPSTDPTPEPGPPSEKPTKELTSETDYDALSEPSAPTGEGSMGNIPPVDIVRYQKGSGPHRFSTLEGLTKEASWGDTWKSAFWAKTRAWR